MKTRRTAPAPALTVGRDSVEPIFPLKAFGFPPGRSGCSSMLRTNPAPQNFTLRWTDAARFDQGSTESRPTGSLPGANVLPQLIVEAPHDLERRSRTRRGQTGRNEPGRRPALRSTSGFTLVEIAIALGVIGFALVAIIGILPVGLQIQRDNRAETIINQDGTFWMEAIRNGARGLDELVEHVESIDIVTYNPVNGAIIASNYYTYNGGYTTGSNIIGLLTTPAYVRDTEARAVVTAISGAAAEKSSSAADRELAFRYQMTVQVERPGNYAPPFSALSTNAVPAPPADPLDSLYELRLNMAYNWVRDTQPGTRHQTYRAELSRNVMAVTNQPGDTPNFFFVQ